MDWTWWASYFASTLPGPHGHLKSLVFETLVAIVEDLMTRIAIASADIAIEFCGEEGGGGSQRSMAMNLWSAGVIQERVRRTDVVDSIPFSVPHHCLRVPFDAAYSRVVCPQDVHCLVYPWRRTTDVSPTNGAMKEGCGWQNGMKLFLQMSHASLCKSHDGWIRVWRHCGERILNSCVMHRHNGLAPGIIIWGGIGYHSRTSLVRIAVLGYSRPSSFHTLPKLVWCDSWRCNLGQSLSNHGPHVFYRRKIRRASRPGKQFNQVIDEEPLDNACHVWSRIILLKYGYGQALKVRKDNLLQHLGDVALAV
ncbi:uncharacterized protein TNCV_925031 [Trichonephila clavipes]|nr:uncharacterized protein TNCV_925031 [Trichonephila clavipes]